MQRCVSPVPPTNALPSPTLTRTCKSAGQPLSRSRSVSLDDAAPPCYGARSADEPPVRVRARVGHLPRACGTHPISQGAAPVPPHRGRRRRRRRGRGATGGRAPPAAPRGRGQRRRPTVATTRLLAPACACARVCARAAPRTVLHAPATKFSVVTATGPTHDVPLLLSRLPVDDGARCHGGSLLVLCSGDDPPTCPTEIIPADTVDGALGRRCR